MDTAIDLQNFFPSKYFKIISIDEKEDSITIKLKSVTKSCHCHICGEETTKYHGTYTRKVQDLPMIGKSVYLEIRTREYVCCNSKCKAKTIAEDFDGFLSYYSRMTERCADFICTLALESSCEGCARICKAMNLKISGDSVIRLLLRRYEKQSPYHCGDTIGIDDFSFKKRHTYGTIIVDQKTHHPIAILDGRDGKTLQEWLKNKKHIRTITRDRATAYAKVIEEELPNAIQVADRFHLHQNLLEAIRACLRRGIPASILIPQEQIESLEREQSKKNFIL